MLITPTLLGAPWACAERATPSASRGSTNILFFTITLLNLYFILAYTSQAKRPNPLERPADREAERRMLLAEWRRRAIERQCAPIRDVVGEQRAVENHGSLQISRKPVRVVRPIEPKRRVH